MDVDIACVGFGPAMGGFLTTLARELLNGRWRAAIESHGMPGMPLQVICYERADDIGFGVSRRGHARARHSRQLPRSRSRPRFPWPRRSRSEKVVYLLDPMAPAAAPRRCAWPTACCALLGAGAARIRPASCPIRRRSCTRKDGLVLSIGQFIQWVGAQLMASGTVQIWPGTPVGEAADRTTSACVGVRLARSGRRSRRQPGRRLHAGHGYSRGPDGGGRRAGGRGRPAARRQASGMPAGHRRSASGPWA